MPPCPAMTRALNQCPLTDATIPSLLFCRPTWTRTPFNSIPLDRRPSIVGTLSDSFSSAALCRPSPSFPAAAEGRPRFPLSSVDGAGPVFNELARHPTCAREAVSNCKGHGGGARARIDGVERDREAQRHLKRQWFCDCGSERRPTCAAVRAVGNERRRRLLPPDTHETEPRAASQPTMNSHTRARA